MVGDTDGSSKGEEREGGMKDKERNKQAIEMVICKIPDLNAAATRQESKLKKDVRHPG